MLNPGLKKILLDALQADNIEYEDTIETVGLWDSMMHMEIMAALEKKYRIRIEPEEIIELTSVKRIQEFLESKDAL